MKRFYLCLALAGACVPAFAQTPTGSRALTRAEVKRANWPSFETGHSGVYAAQYVALQFLLRNQGFFKGTIQDDWSENSQRTIARDIKTFQRARHLKVDAIVGSQTWARLCPRLKRGDRGEAVCALQTLLDTPVDGLFGFETERVLRQEQKNRRLKVDGLVGAQTWAALLLPPEPQGD